MDFMILLPENQESDCYKRFQIHCHSDNFIENQTRVHVADIFPTIFSANGHLNAYTLITIIDIDVIFSSAPHPVKRARKKDEQHQTTKSTPHASHHRIWDVKKPSQAEIDGAAGCQTRAIIMIYSCP